MPFKKNKSATKTPAAPAKQLTDKELKSLSEVHVAVNLKGFLTAWDYVFNKKPFALYQGVARRMEGFSKKMMTGNASIIGMPVGIIVRNTSRAAHNLSTGRYSHIAQAAGVLAAFAAVGAATFVAGPVIASAIGLGGFGTVVGYAAAAVASGVVLNRPAYTAGTLTTSSVIAAGVAAFSTLIAAPANLLVAFRRSRASLKGVKLTEDQLLAQQAEFDRRSPAAEYERQQEEQVRYGLASLSPAKKEKIYLSLKAEFDLATKQAAEQKPAVAAATVAGQKPKTPTQG